MEWQPIEAAPKDGRMLILGKTGEKTSFPGRFSRLDNHFLDSAGFFRDPDVFMEFPKTPSKSARG